jgi:hypothetical protein
MLYIVYGNIAVSHMHTSEWFKRFREAYEDHTDDLRVVTNETMKLGM